MDKLMDAFDVVRIEQEKMVEEKFIDDTTYKRCIDQVMCSRGINERASDARA